MNIWLTYISYADHMKDVLIIKQYEFKHYTEFSSIESCLFK